MESVPHTNPQTPNRSVHFHSSPPTKTHFFLQRQQPANCIHPPLALPPPENDFGGKYKGTIYILFPPWFQFTVIFSWVLTRRVVLASGRSRRGIKSPAVFSSIKCLGPAKEAHVGGTDFTVNLTQYCLVPKRGALTLWDLPFRNAE